MKRLKVYEYANCSTCKKALKFLDKKKISYDRIAIVETPPSKTELKKMLAHYDGQLGKLFNTSGVVYREMKLGEKLKKMPTDEALALLASNGKLVKRPFLLSDDIGLVGFKEDEWSNLSSRVKKL